MLATAASDSTSDGHGSNLGRATRRSRLPHSAHDSEMIWTLAMVWRVPARSRLPHRPVPAAASGDSHGRRRGAGRAACRAPSLRRLEEAWRLRPGPKQHVRGRAFRQLQCVQEGRRGAASSAGPPPALGPDGPCSPQRAGPTLLAGSLGLSGPTLLAGSRPQESGRRARSAAGTPKPRETDSWQGIRNRASRSLNC